MPLPTSRLVAALFVFVCLAPSARAAENLLQPIGWSEDERRVAVRVYAYDSSGEDDGAEEPVECPGYVDHKGEKFRGALRFEVYEKGQKVAAFPIQDSEKCTPPKVARERLNKAKAALAKLGIDLKQKQPGTELTPENPKGVATFTVKEGPGAPYTLEGEEDVEDVLEKEGGAKAAADSEEEAPEDDNGFVPHHVKGALVVYVSKGDERRQLLSKPVAGTYTSAMAGCYRERLARVWLSPKGKTAVFVSEFMGGNMRARDDSFSILGMVSWEGAPLVLR